jgi:hypothetical protein
VTDLQSHIVSVLREGGGSLCHARLRAALLDRGLRSQAGHFARAMARLLDLGMINVVGDGWEKSGPIIALQVKPHPLPTPAPAKRTRPRPGNGFVGGA